MAENDERPDERPAVGPDGDPSRATVAPGAGQTPGAEGRPAAPESAALWDRVTEAVPPGPVAPDSGPGAPPPQGTPPMGPYQGMSYPGFYHPLWGGAPGVMLPGGMPPGGMPPGGGGRRRRRPASLVARVVVGAAVAIATAALAGSEFGYFASRSFALRAPSAVAPQAPGGGGAAVTPGGAAPVSPGGAAQGAAQRAANQVAAKVAPGLVDINAFLGYTTGESAGTGMVLTSSGEVLTNNHVIDGATSITATDLGNGQTYRARVVGYDASADVAVLQLEDASGLATVALGSSSSVKVGEKVVGIGNAGGVGGSPAVVPGEVTGLQKSITATSETGTHAEHLHGLVETNADIVPGDSGGPLVTMAGKVVGMDTAAAGTMAALSGHHAYAIPIATAHGLAAKITAGSSSATIHVGPTAFMGVALSASGSVKGAPVLGVLPGTPAAASGLGAGDTITAVNGSPVRSGAALGALVRSDRPGQKIAVAYTGPTGTHHEVSLRLMAGPAK